jgi:hypothetical protein
MLRNRGEEEADWRKGIDMASGPGPVSERRRGKVEVGRRGEEEGSWAAQDEMGRKEMGR